MSYLYRIEFGPEDKTSDIDYKEHTNELDKSAKNFDDLSEKAKNPKSIKSMDIKEKTIVFTIESTHKVNVNRAGNMLWLFSNYLVEEQGFEQYTTNKGKLFRSVKKSALLN